MELTELREQIDVIDRELTALLEKRMDVSADIAAWKQAAKVPVLDSAREAAKLDDIRSRCRPETRDLIADVFRAVLAASRALQTARMEGQYEQ